MRDISGRMAMRQVINEVTRKIVATPILYSNFFFMWSEITLPRIVENVECHGSLSPVSVFR